MSLRRFDMVTRHAGQFPYASPVESAEGSWVLAEDVAELLRHIGANVEAERYAAQGEKDEYCAWHIQMNDPSARSNREVVRDDDLSKAESAHTVAKQKTDGLIKSGVVSDV